MAHDELRGAKAFASGENFTDGAGLVVVKKVLYKKMTGGKTFVLETQVVSSTDKAELNKDGTPAKANAVGSNPSVRVVLKGGVNDPGPGNIKKIVCAIAGMNVDKIHDSAFDEKGKLLPEFTDKDGSPIPGWIDELDALADEEGENAQPATGALLKYDSYRKATKEQQAKSAPRKDWNVYVNFTHVGEAGGNSPEAIAARAAKLAAGQDITLTDAQGAAA